MEKHAWQFSVLLLASVTLNSWLSPDTKADENRFVIMTGEGKQFHFVTKVGADSPGAYRGFADIDHVVSDVFKGNCRYLGIDDNSPPAWEGIYFDHVPVVCTLDD